MSHTFAVEGKQVRITLPVIPEDAPKGAFPSWTGNHSIRYAGFNIVDGKHVPYVCDVTNIQITVTAQADLALPPDYIPTARMPDIPRHIQDVFQQVYVEQRQVAEQAFRHWRDVLRWKTLDGSLGRPQIVHHGHEQTVRDALTGTKVFSGVIALSGLIDAREGLDQPKWEHIQNLLATNTQAPIWFDFLFQGEYRRELGDVTEAVVNFAISCELLIRQLFVLYRSTDLRHRFALTRPRTLGRSDWRGPERASGSRAAR